MKPLVTGATGIVGYNIVKALLEQGRQVRVLVRSMEEAAQVLPPECELVEGDVTDKKSVLKAVTDCSVVYHAAGLPEQWLPDPSLFHQVNSLGTRNIVEAALQAGVKKFIYISTIDIFSVKPGSEYDETALGNLPSKSLYGRSKQEAEQFVADGIKKGLPACFVHPAGVYGPGPKESQWFMDFIKKMKQGKIPAVPPGVLPVVFSEDLAAGCLLIERNAPIGERYIFCESARTWGEIVQVVASELGIKKVPAILPFWLAWMIATTGTAISTFTKKPPLLQRQILRFLQLGARPSSAKARRQLGWEPRSFREGVRKTIEFVFPQHKELVPPPLLGTAARSPLACLICSYETGLPNARDLGIVRGNTERFKNQIFHLWRCPRCESIQNIDAVDYRAIYSDYPLNKRRLDIFARGTMRNLLRRLKRAGLRKTDAILD